MHVQIHELAVASSEGAFREYITFLLIFLWIHSSRTIL